MMRCQINVVCLGINWPTWRIHAIDHLIISLTADGFVHKHTIKLLHNLGNFYFFKLRL